MAESREHVHAWHGRVTRAEKSLRKVILIAAKNFGGMRNSQRTNEILRCDQDDSLSSNKTLQSPGCPIVFPILPTVIVRQSSAALASRYNRKTLAIEK